MLRMAYWDWRDFNNEWLYLDWLDKSCYYLLGMLSFVRHGKVGSNKANRIFSTEHCIIGSLKGVEEGEDKTVEPLAGLLNVEKSLL